MMVPEAGEPPTTPSTDQVTLPKPEVAVNCCVWVNVTTAARGLIENPAVTVRLVEPLIEPTAAWIVVLPGATPAAKPVLLMVATDGMLDVQVAELVRSW